MLFELQYALENNAKYRDVRSQLVDLLQHRNVPLPASYLEDPQRRYVCESVAEQVAQLVDHATDERLLGRMWGGWAPFL